MITMSEAILFAERWRELPELEGAALSSYRSSSGGADRSPAAGS